MRELETVRLNACTWILLVLSQIFSTPHTCACVDTAVYLQAYISYYNSPVVVKTRTEDVVTEIVDIGCRPD
jgi:hypothetical protein